MRVQAVYCGEYGGQFYEAGDVFDVLVDSPTLDSNITMDSNLTLDAIQSGSAFSDNTVNYGPNSATIQLGWMIEVASTTPLYQARTTGITSVGTWLPPQDGGRRTVY